VKKINAGNLMITTTWWSNIFLRFRWCQAAKLWHLIGIRSPVGIQIQGVSGWLGHSGVTSVGASRLSSNSSQLWTVWPGD
jgi:hypothetical protein